MLLLLKMMMLLLLMMFVCFREFKGVVVLVSHDQNLLQRACHQVKLSPCSFFFGILSISYFVLLLSQPEPASARLSPDFTFFFLPEIPIVSKTCSPFFSLFLPFHVSSFCASVFLHYAPFRLYIFCPRCCLTVEMIPNTTCNHPQVWVCQGGTVRVEQGGVQEYRRRVEKAFTLSGWNIIRVKTLSEPGKENPVRNLLGTFHTLWG